MGWPSRCHHDSDSGLSAHPPRAEVVRERAALVGGVPLASRLEGLYVDEEDVMLKRSRSKATNLMQERGSNKPMLASRFHSDPQNSEVAGARRQTRARVSGSAGEPACGVHDMAHLVPELVSMRCGNV